MKTKRQKMVFHDRPVVRQLSNKLEKHELNQAIEATARRFGISRDDVVHALNGGDFYVRTTKR